MEHATYTFQSKVWLYEGFGGWHFVNVPKQESQEIKERFGAVKSRGFGSIRVMVTIGKSTWKTSIFPSSPHKTSDGSLRGTEDGYLLAIKQQIRTVENVAEGDIVRVTIAIRDV